MVLPIDQYPTLDKLKVGVLTTFQPTDADLVGHYLYNKVFSNYNTFPVIRIYGENGMPPSEIWKKYKEDKFPHHDFIYFFSQAEMNPSKKCNSRKVGTDGYTWSATQKPKPVYIDGVQGLSGSRRTYRYEKNTKDKKGKRERVFDEHHCAWLMEEFTINSSPDLAFTINSSPDVALCRLKVNDRGGDRNNKRKKSSASEEDVLMEKQKLDQGTCTITSQQMPSSSFHEDDDQVAHVVPENSDNNYDELEQILMSDDDHTLINDERVDERMMILSDCLVAPQQQLEPAENRCKEEYQVQLPHQDQASSSHPNEQQLPSDNGVDIPWDSPYLQSDEFINGCQAYW